MSFAAGFVPTLGRALGRGIRGRRAILLGLVLAGAPALAAVLDVFSPHPSKLIIPFVLFLYGQFLVPVVALLFGTGVIADESSGGNLPYLFTRPVPRSSIVLGKYAAAVLLGCIGLGISLSVTLAILDRSAVPDDFAGRAMMAVLLGLPAYLAAFTLLSVLTRWGLLAGFLYAFGVEGYLSLIPGMIKKITLLYYSRSLLGSWDAGRLSVERILGGVTGASPERSVATLLVVAVVGIVLTCFLVRRKEFVARTAEAA